MKKTQKGFGVMEVILLLAMAGVLVGIGWYAWQRHTSKQSTQIDTRQTEGQQPTNTPASLLQAYEDDFIRFDHPKDWKIERQYTFADTYGAYYLNINAPADPTLKAADASKTNLYLHTAIVIAHNDRFDGLGQPCTQECTVYHSEQISPKSPALKGSLVVSDWDSQNYAGVAIFAQGTVRTWQKTYKTGLAINDSYYTSISANYMSGSRSSVRLEATEAFQDSAQYKQLKDLISTITFKTDKLP